MVSTHGTNTLADDIGLTNNMYSQYPVSLLLAQELDLSLRIKVRLRPRVSCEGEFSNVVFDTRSFQVLLGPADPCYFRVGIHDGGDSGVIDVAVA
jgi:hypothetical protein